MKRLKATLDTNIIVSGIILEHGNSFSLLELWRQGAFLLIASPELIGEVIDVLTRAKTIKRYDIPIEKLSTITTLLKKKSRIIGPRQIPFPTPLRDPKDLFILETAMTGGADYLVTGDNDLLSVKGSSSIKPLRVVTPKLFLDILRGDIGNRF